MGEISQSRRRGLLRTAAAAVLIGAVLLLTPRAEAAGGTPVAERKLIPVGKAVGIKLFSKGVMVIGFSEVETGEGSASPARDCGLKQGDIITNINSETVNTIDQVSDLLQELEGEEMSLRVSRGGRTLQLRGEAVKCSADGCYKLGAYIRDSMAGIGTITFYDPETGQFGALGHGISDGDTGLLMPISSGGIMAAEVTDVIRGQSGSPGALHGTFDLKEDLGRLTANTDCGVFGTVEQGLWTGEALPVAKPGEVKVGEVTILSNVEGNEVEEYTAEIIRVYPAAVSDTRNLMLKITDQRLLELTGGVVQGMSGSPIIQNGKLVGAVTHVLVNDPTRGYGIFIENMLEAAS